jgi:hypothetical protein
LEVAMRVKSLPVMPSRTSLNKSYLLALVSKQSRGCLVTHILKLMKIEAGSEALEVHEGHTRL